MLFADNEYGERIRATPKATAICPTCSAAMIAKCGRIKVWHWSHQSFKDCDTWSEGETAWHAAWKSRFQNTEVTMRSIASGVEQTHRADAVTGSGTVIEFQHSAISTQDVIDRERFYGDMVWVLDATKPFRNDRIQLRHEAPESGSPFCKFIWSHRRTSFDHASATIFLDLGLAWRNIGRWFFKEKSHWWDDSDGGLRDGRRRGRGAWQRVEVIPLLIEIKKTTGAFGWGRAVTHGEFCRRFGGRCCDENDSPAMALRRESEFDTGLGAWDWPGKRAGYSNFSSSLMNGVKFDGEYEWCEKELQKGVTV